jgi:predicted nucleic acid-binding protein
MRRVFADAQYWVALLNDRDQGHAAARAATRALRGIPLVTTEDALSEVLAFFCEGGPHLRQLASSTVRGLFANPSISVVPQSHQSFLDGLTLYEARQDKDYSLTDCTSMNVMRREGIKEMLTADAHFEQEGFIKLL